VAEENEYRKQEIERLFMRLDQLYGYKSKLGSEYDLWEDRHGEPNEYLAEQLNSIWDAIRHTEQAIKDLGGDPYGDLPF